LAENRPACVVCRSSYIVSPMSIRQFENINPEIAASAWVDDTALVIGDVSLA
jgi:hypothetical protein